MLKKITSRCISVKDKNSSLFRECKAALKGRAKVKFVKREILSANDIGVIEPISITEKQLKLREERLEELEEIEILKNKDHYIVLLLFEGEVDNEDEQGYENIRHNENIIVQRKVIDVSKEKYVLLEEELREGFGSAVNIKFKRSQIQKYDERHIYIPMLITLGKIELEAKIIKGLKEVYICHTRDGYEIEVVYIEEFLH